MTDFAHTIFTARTAAEFRRGLRAAIAADAAIYQDDRGIERHSVMVNGRQIYYAATVAGRSIHVTDLNTAGIRTTRAKTYTEGYVLIEDALMSEIFGIPARRWARIGYEAL